LKTRRREFVDMLLFVVCSRKREVIIIIIMPTMTA